MPKKVYNLYKLFKKYEIQFNNFYENSNLDKSTKSGRLNAFNKFIDLLDVNISKPIHIIDIYDENSKGDLNSKKYTFEAINNFLELLEKREEITEEMLENYKKKLTLNAKKKYKKSKTNKPLYEIDEEKFEKSLSDLKNHNKYYYLFVQILYWSGCRIVELDKIIETFDKNKVRIYEEEKIITYEANLFRGNKNLEYLFLPLSLYEDFLNNLKELKKIKSSAIKKYIGRAELLPMKFYRKYSLSHMISEMSYYSVYYIQGRSLEEDVVFKHYMLNILGLSIKEYSKYILKNYYMSDLINLERWSNLDTVQKIKLFNSLYDEILNLYYLSDELKDKELNDKFELLIDKNKFLNESYDFLLKFESNSKLMILISNFLNNSNINLKSDITKFIEHNLNKINEIEKEIKSLEKEINDTLIVDKERFFELIQMVDLDEGIELMETIFDKTNKNFDFKEDILTHYLEDLSYISEKEFQKLLPKLEHIEIYTRLFSNENKVFINKINSLYDEMFNFIDINYFYSLLLKDNISKTLEDFELYLDNKKFKQFQLYQKRLELNL